jgi:NAD(P)-dependent dehydrogenase (short-subunit alcohol dehydrogenase family)
MKAKVVVVIGVSSGIGYETARQASVLGAQLMRAVRRRTQRVPLARGSPTELLMFRTADFSCAHEPSTCHSGARTPPKAASSKRGSQLVVSDGLAAGYIT